MKTAKEMYEFCKKYGFGSGMGDAWCLKHFSVIQNNLSNDEKALLTFIGLRNYISLTKHDNNFAYAITNKRILIAQKKIIGEIIQTVSLDNINDITFKKGLALGIITIDSIKETFNVAIEGTNADKLYKLITELIRSLTKSDSNSSNDLNKLEDLKRLADKGVITQREFELKKKQILGI